MIQISSHLEKADLDGALQAALTQVKTQPTDTQARRLLIDLLIVAGDFERADKQADILSKTSVDTALAMGLLRGRLRAASARQAWFSDGAVPAFPEGPTDRDRAAMELAVARREGDAQSIKIALEALTAMSETGGLKVNGKPVQSFRDADDRIPHALEVLCTDGSYMWIDFGLVEDVTFPQIKVVRDLAWRPAKLTMRDGSETEVIVCSTYFATDPTNDERLARSTDWVEEAGIVYGRGQKTFLIDDDAITAVDLTSLSAA